MKILSDSNSLIAVAAPLARQIAELREQMPTLGRLANDRDPLTAIFVTIHKRSKETLQ